VGWHLHKSLHAEGTIKALEMALEQKGIQPLSHSTIHHSDRGVQRSTPDIVAISM
jgi:transposase InsO family protein